MRTTRAQAVVALPAPGASAFPTLSPQGLRTLATLLPAAPTFQPIRLAWAVVAILLLTLISAFFAMAEIALITVRKTRIRQLAEEGNRSARLIERMLEQPTLLQATVQTGVTLVFTFSTVIAAAVTVAPLAHWLHQHYPRAVAGSAVSFALILVALPVAMLTLVVGQIAPK